MIALVVITDVQIESRTRFIFVDADVLSRNRYIQDASCIVPIAARSRSLDATKIQPKLLTSNLCYLAENTILSKFNFDTGNLPAALFQLAYDLLADRIKRKLPNTGIEKLHNYLLVEEHKTTNTIYYILYTVNSRNGRA